MITQVERRREWSLALSLTADSLLLVSYGVVVLGSGSLTILAETVRGTILLALGWAVLVFLRRVHRQKLRAYEYGIGKLEQFTNFLIGGTLILGAIWVGGKAAISWGASPAPLTAGADAWMLAAAVLAGINALVNAGAFLALWRAGRDGTSLIMRGQVHARLGKLITSVVVVGAVGVTAALPGTPTAWAANLGGAIFVVAVMLWIGINLLRETLPDLLDRALAESRQVAINRTLTHHFDSYETLESVRSRQAGKRLYIEIALGFDPGRSFGEVAAICRDMSHQLEALVPGAEVTVIPVTPAA
jgi:cation diffusion facilitator family transporter